MWEMALSADNMFNHFCNDCPLPIAGMILIFFYIQMI